MDQFSLHIPEISLVVLIGVSGSGKSSFARAHFSRTEIVSSDECRALIADDENNQRVTPDAFEVLNLIVAKRLRYGKLTVVDATNVQPESRMHLLTLARRYHAPAIAIVLDMPEALCLARHRKRTDRHFAEQVIQLQHAQLRDSVDMLEKEGFKKVFVLESEEQVAAVKEIGRVLSPHNKKWDKGPFDIIGDIHGCAAELWELLEKLGYQIQEVEDDGINQGLDISHPAGRKVIFLGDLVDRGPDSPGVIRIAMSMVAQKKAWCVIGNHDMKLLKKLMGKNVTLTHGLEITMEQLELESITFIDGVKSFLGSLMSHYQLDGGRLVIAHAGIKEEMQGRKDGAVKSFCMFGETTGQSDEFGLPIRYNWAKDYRGEAKVIYGHTPVPEPRWQNRTINIDTGCVFGGRLTALRYPEEELVSVEARQNYAPYAKPMFNTRNPEV
jgi:protein phosphatase